MGKAVKYKIKKNDNVMVVSGKEKGKTGIVHAVIPEKGRVIVTKLNMIKRHTKPNAQSRQGGIVEKEAPIDISNVMIYCDKCAKPVRVGYNVSEDGTKVRACKKCGEVIDR